MQHQTPEWKAYHKAVKDFEKMIKQKEFHFSILCEMLKRDINDWPEEWKNDPEGMAGHFQTKMKREIDMARSCDAPNPPNYYRANND